MKTAIVTTLAILLLSGCTEFRTMYKVGNTKTETNIDQGQCNSFAANAYPPRIVTDWIPIYDSEGRVRGHRVEQYDINESRRIEGARDCMVQKGYEWATVPYCKDEQIGGRSYAPITTNPPMSANICGLRQEGGGRVLIDLSKPI